MVDPERPRRRRVLLSLRILGGLLLLIGLLRITVAWLLPYAIVHVPEPVFGCRPDQAALTVPAISGPAQTQVVVIRSGPIVISWRDFPPESRSRTDRSSGTVFLLHGHGDCKESQTGIAEAMFARGYRVIVPDLPAHNGSSGEFVTFGVREGEAIAALIDSLAPEGSDRPIFTWGHSLGGATAIQAAARNRRVDGVVSISAFSSLNEVVPDYLNAFLPGWRLLISDEGVDRAVAEAGRIARFDPERASTVDAAARLSIPLVVLHGDEDRRMPPDHAVRIARANGGGGSLRLVPGAGHSDVYHTVGTRRLVNELLDSIESRGGEK